MRHLTSLLLPAVTCILTPAGTAQIETLDLNPGPASSMPVQFLPMGDAMFITGFGPSGNPSIFRVDLPTGSSGPAMPAATLVVGAGDPAELTVVGEQLFFRYNFGGTTGLELARLDSNGNVALAHEAHPTGHGFPSGLTAVDDRLFYFAEDGVHGNELWVRTSGGAALVKDIVPGPQGSTTFNTEIIRFGNGIAFTVDDGTSGAELWFSDGTSGGTYGLDLNPGANGSGPRNLTVFGGELFFVASATAGSGDVWRSDGTSTGTLPLVMTTASLRELTPVDDELFLIAGPLFDEQLWRLQGNAFVQVPTTQLPHRQVWGVAGAGDRVYFFARTSTPGQQLYGPSELCVLDPGAIHPRTVRTPNQQRLQAGIAVAMSPISEGRTDTLAFAADDGSSGEELWITAGEPGDARLVQDLVPGIGFSLITSPIAHRGYLFFSAVDGAGQEPRYVPLPRLEAAATWSFGDGCTGTSGQVPGLAANQLPILGAATFGFTVDGVQPGTPVVLGLGLDQSRLQLGSCTLLVDQIVTTLAAIADGSGVASTTLVLPATPTLLGLRAFAQALSLDGGPFLGMGSLSAGLGFVIGS